MSEATVRTIRVRNPRTGTWDYTFAAPSDEDLASRCAELRRHQTDWAAASLDQRTATLADWKAALAQRRDAIVAALAVDTGRHLIAAAEFAGVVASIDRWCANAPAIMADREGRSSVHPSITFQRQLVPYVLVGVVSPWNFPLTLSLIDAVPALLAGCAVIIKPSEVAPRFAAPLREAIAAVPALAQVFDVCPGDGRTGANLVAQVDVVCFTGSVQTGRRVAEAAARRFIPAFLELGGKDPAIVTRTADVQRAADIVLRASILATGQACQSLERIYVDASIYDEFVTALVAKARAVELAYPDPRAGVIGPLIFERQAHIIADQLDDACVKGARVLCGGTIETHGGGRWIRPTVLVNVDHTMKVMTEETFGPVMPVMSCATIDEAVELANESEYGLSAAVIAATLDEAEAIGRRIDAGAISLNDGALTAVMYEAEKNSFRLSGMGGSRTGAAGLLRFFRTKALIRQTGEPATIGMFDESNAAGN
jgi:acyl-CoA reductase-like NAD-dependent aldehyde dehydrogenase